MALVHFVIPVRDLRRFEARDAALVNLRTTLASLQGQTDADWTCTVVHSSDEQIARMADDQVHVLPVDLPETLLPEEQNEERLRLIRNDKGLRVAAGFDPSHRFTMVVDYDDLLRDDVVATIREHADSDAVAFTRCFGLYAPRTVRLLTMNPDGSGCGGSCIALASAALEDPATLPSGTQRHMRHFGSHVSSLNDWKDAGKSIARVAGEPRVLYRLGDAHSASASERPSKIIGTFVKQGKLRRAYHFIRSLQKLSDLELARYGL